MEKEKIYRLNDDISFRQCQLCHGKNSDYGDCTNHREQEENWKPYYYCNQEGIHLHCTKHPEIEFDYENSYSDTTLKCPKCNNEIEIGRLTETINKCVKMLNIEKFKNAQLIRLDDWYIPEIKEKVKTESGYWINAVVKTDKDTIVVIYIGHNNSKEKAQFFVKPEKCQLTNDHKDLDPSKILSKIEVTLKDRTLNHNFD